MRRLGATTKSWVLGSALLFSHPIVSNNAQANPSLRHDNTSIQDPVATSGNSDHARALAGPEGRLSRLQHNVDKRSATYPYAISCVPYARQISGIRVTGNAWQWWARAAGQYARGDRPEVGSVLNFRPNGRMVLGHVAVVKKVVNAREVIIDHANWPNGRGRGVISRNVAVVDVSEANNWSAVRVELAAPGTFGSVYPTYGFIYNRPDTGFVTASIARPAPQPDINPIPSDLRPKAERPWRLVEEVAESQATRPSSAEEPAAGVPSNP